MFTTNRRALVAATLALSIAALAVAVPVRAASTRDPSMLLESKAAVRRALGFLAANQKPNGSWEDQPAITALVVMGMVSSGEEGYGAKSPAVTKALDFIRSYAQPDGGIYDKYYATYSTSLCVTALAQAHLPQDTDLINRAWAYLLDLQADESEGFGTQDTQYGGWGYERNSPGEIAQGEDVMHRADVSNTAFALEAIKDLQDLCEQEKATGAGGAAIGAPADLQERTGLAYQHAILYLQRCQNLKTTNDQPWAANDGGFVYRPGESKAGQSADGGLRSYGGMTYAGLKSMIYAKLATDDPRVVAAPRMGPHALERHREPRPRAGGALLLLPDDGARAEGLRLRAGGGREGRRPRLARRAGRPAPEQPGRRRLLGQQELPLDGEHPGPGDGLQHPDHRARHQGVVRRR